MIYIQRRSCCKGRAAHGNLLHLQPRHKEQKKTGRRFLSISPFPHPLLYSQEKPSTEVPRFPEEGSGEPAKCRQIKTVDPGKDSGFVVSVHWSPSASGKQGGMSSCNVPARAAPAVLQVPPSKCHPPADAVMVPWTSTAPLTRPGLTVTAPSTWNHSTLILPLEPQSRGYSCSRLLEISIRITSLLPARAREDGGA